MTFRSRIENSGIVRGTKQRLRPAYELLGRKTRVGDRTTLRHVPALLTDASSKAERARSNQKHVFTESPFYISMDLYCTVR